MKKLFISAALGLGLAAAPLTSAFALPPPGSFYYPMHSTHDKGAAVLANQRASAMRTSSRFSPSSAYSLYAPAHWRR